MSKFTKISNQLFGRGKLLLCGEYAALDGAKCIALPTVFGQHMTVKKHRGSDLGWKSYDKDGNIWFQAKISLYDFSAIECTNDEIAKNLKTVLKNAVRLNSEFLSKWNGFNVETRLDFPLEWGLGSSSTLIYLVAEWAEVNPLLLHFKISNGSGYDVASAGAELPILYQLLDDRVQYNEIDFELPFQDKLYFVYSGQKQLTKTSVEDYLKNAKGRKTFAKKITAITEQMLEVKTQQTFNELIQEHEGLVAAILNQKPISETHFGDFKGVVKSLGAWGGDFFLASSEMDSNSTIEYFKSKGHNTILSYGEIFKTSLADQPA